jgi:hypothetical protein
VSWDVSTFRDDGFSDHDRCRSFYRFCIAMKTENERRDSVQHTMRILAALGADRVKERQADARRRPRAEYGSRQSEDLRRPAESPVGRQWHWPLWRRQRSSLELGHRFTSTDVILDFNAAEQF